MGRDFGSGMNGSQQTQEVNQGFSLNSRVCVCCAWFDVEIAQKIRTRHISVDSNRNRVAKKESNKMRSLGTSVKRFLVSEDGPTAVEYAVMLALIVVVCLSAVGTIGTNATGKFTTVGDELGK